MDEMDHTRPGSRLMKATVLFKAAAHPARLRILAMLRPGALCVCQVTAVLERAASTVSAHLAELRRAGLVEERKDGRWVSYGLSRDPAVAELLERAWSLIRDDPQVEADARLARGLRRIPVDELCRVELDITRLGLRRPAVRQTGRSL
jgi:DNA-binding transcriptional ArsR family regulator